MKLWQTLLPSPIQAIVLPSIEPRCSSIVIRSARIWHGWLRSVRPLSAGTVETRAKRSTSSWSLARIITASTMRDRTRAVSSTGSPRPSCMSDAVAMMESPPSCRMAASKLKRVRVEFFSKTMARTRSLPGASASGRPWGQPLRARLRAWASSRMARKVAASSRWMSRKWRTISNSAHPAKAGTQYYGRATPECCHPPLPQFHRRQETELSPRFRGDERQSGSARHLGAGDLAGLLELLDGLAGFFERDVERRQDADQVVAAAGDQQSGLVAGPAHEVAVVGDQLDAQQQALAAHLDDHVGKALGQTVQLLLQIAGDLVDVGQDGVGRHLGEGGLADGHGQGVAAEGRAVGAHRHALGR